MADERPLILALTEDLLLLPRFEDAARDLGFRFTVLDSTDIQRADADAAPQAILLTEPLEGPDAQFFRKIVDMQPALLLIDTSSAEFPWERWIRTLKTAAATRRIPIVAFGPHVAKQVLDRAEQAGADEIVSRGRLHASLGEIINRRARRVDQRVFEEACQGSPSELASQGLRRLNAGEFYQAHELLEAAWMEATEVEGYLYRALLQIAVSYLQVERRNYAGAVKMLLRLKQWLDPLPDRCRGVDVASLKRGVVEFSTALEAAGPEGIAELEFRPLPVSWLSDS
jgi:CheY-like chemotaxis protein